MTTIDTTRSLPTTSRGSAPAAPVAVAPVSPTMVGDRFEASTLPDGTAALAPSSLLSDLLARFHTLVDRLLHRPAPTPSPAPTPAPARTHTVVSGESLSRIAKQELGDAQRWREIYELNRGQIANPDLIVPGQVLKLPGGGAVPAPQPAPTPSPKPTPKPAPKPTPALPPTPASHEGPLTDRKRIYLHQPNNWTCGPTSLTMAAAAFGVRPASVTTVNDLTRRSRTKPAYGVPDSNALQDAAREIGMKARYQASSTPADVRAALEKGHGVVYNGSLGRGGHFVYVAGLNSDGTFIVCDPWRPDVTRWTAAQLNAFGHTNGHSGAITEVWK